MNIFLYGINTIIKRKRKFYSYVFRKLEASYGNFNDKLVNCSHFYHVLFCDILAIVAGTKEFIFEYNINFE